MISGHCVARWLKVADDPILNRISQIWMTPLTESVLSGSARSAKTALRSAVRRLVRHFVHPGRSGNSSHGLHVRLLLLYLCALCGAAATVCAADRHFTTGAPPEAELETRGIRLPVVDRADIRFLRFDTIEGPPKSNAGPIVQDNQGFIWFGTPYGLNRFDGYTFKVFTHDPRDPKSISGSLITALFKDRNGTLWIGCSQFLNRFDSATAEFTKYPVPYVFDISQTADGILWLSTPTGLYALDPATEKIRRYAHDPNDPQSLESNDIKSTGEDRQGGFWVATSEGLDSFDRETAKVTFHISLEESSYPLSFYEDRLGTFWIYHESSNHPLATLDRTTKTVTVYSFGTTVTGISGMLEDQSGTLWLATSGAGLLKLDREHHRFVRYRHRIGDSYSLSQDSVRNLFMDRQGIIWVSLGGYGLTRFSPAHLAFQRYRSDFGNPADRDEPFVGAIYEDAHGVLWIGTHSALHRIDRGAGTFQDFQLNAKGDSTDAITMCEDRSGYLWVGTYNHGLFRFDPRTNQVKSFRHDSADPQSLSNDIVPRVFIDHNGTLWAATHDGLDRYDPVTGHFTTYRVEAQGVNPYYLGAAEDRSGILWLGTESSGLLRFDPATGKFTLYQHQFDQPHTLNDNRVNAIHFDRSGAMWVGTQEGLNRFDEKTGGFTSYSRQNGLPGSAVSCILEDDRGDLWMSTENGIANFDPKTSAIKSYSTADGLPGPDLTGWGTCFETSQGEMFFGGFSGATAFFPKNVTDNSYVPPVALTDFRLFGVGVQPGADPALKKTINYTDIIELSHEENRFSFEFSALSYLNPRTNRYRYMLEGLDSRWNEVGSDERVASYTTLPAGRYTFRVEGATSRGPWNEPGAVLRIRILPAWWNTWWFRLCYVVALCLLAAAIYMYRKRQMRLEVERNERLRHAQADLAHMSRVSTMGELAASLAHEIKQPIAAAVLDAQTCLRWLRREPPNTVEAQNAASRAVQDITRASGIIGRVARFFKKDGIERERVDINELVLEMVDLMRAEAQRHKVLIHTDLELGLPQIMADRVGLQQVMMNLMLNGIEAIRETGSDGVLTVRSGQDSPSMLIISVSDTGIGVQAAQEQKIYDMFFTTKPKGTGMGLPISRSIVESHGGRLWVTKNMPQGAVFQFTIENNAVGDVRTSGSSTRQSGRTVRM